MTISLDTSVLINWYQARAGLTSGGLAVPANSSAAKIPTAPWTNPARAPAQSALVRNALTGKTFIDEKAAKLDIQGASQDYKKLFALYQGLTTLEALANAANDSKTSAYDLGRIQDAFDRGMDELNAYMGKARFDNFRLNEGTVTGSATSTSVATASDSYTTAPLHAGTASEAVDAFQGAVQFAVTVKKVSGTLVTVNFDLAEMGTTPRSMNSVASYINGKLQAAGVGARVSVEKSVIPAQSMTVNGKPVEISPAKDQFAFKFSGLSAETLTFSAPSTSPAVYVSQAAGDPDPDGKASTDDGVQQQDLLKFEADGLGADAARRPGDQNFVAGRVFSEKLPDGVANVRASATGADGSVYMLADATGAVAGQPIKGDKDVVLLKYDSAGDLVYARTLGAGEAASGFSLAVAADGKVAVAGSVTGKLDPAQPGLEPAKSDSFVTLFDAKGDEAWTQRQGAYGEDEASAVAFDASGNVYVAGRTQGSMGGAALGGWDGYLRAYDSKGAILSTRQFGTGGDDKVSGLVVNGADVIVAGQDGTSAMLRRFDMSNPRQPVLAATRNLGSLGGGSITGIGLDGSGNLLIGGSAGSDLTIGTTTAARSGGVDAFGARVAADLSVGASDAVAYYGGAGEDRVTAATVAGGKVWVTGTSKTALPGLAAVGKTDGFVAALDVGAGAVTYSQRFTAKDQWAQPETIAVDTGGASALDRLGLPHGTVQYGQSELLSSLTSVRAGDQFKIKSDSGSATTITIAADDTLKTLAAKIRAAGYFNIDVTTLTSNGTTQLRLKPVSDRHTFEVQAGPEGRNALDSLGLKAGLYRNTRFNAKKQIVPADGGKQTYALRLNSEVDLESKAHIKSTLEQLSNALSTVRAIYSDLKKAAMPPDPLEGVTPEASARFKAQMADYQAALARLSASADAGADNGSSLASLIG